MADPLSQQLGVRAAIDQDALPRDVAGVRAAQIGAEPAEFLRLAEALGRQLRPARRQRRLGADAFLLRNVKLLISRSVANGPGRMLLMVTLRPTCARTSLLTSPC